MLTYLCCLIIVCCKQRHTFCHLNFEKIIFEAHFLSHRKHTTLQTLSGDSTCQVCSHMTSELLCVLFFNLINMTIVIWTKYIFSDSNFVLAKNWFIISNNDLNSQLRCSACKSLSATITLPTSDYRDAELWIFEVQNTPYVDVSEWAVS